MTKYLPLGLLIAALAVGIAGPVWSRSVSYTGHTGATGPSGPAGAKGDAGSPALATGTLQTTDATANQVVAVYTPPVSSMVDVEVSFSALKSDSTVGRYQKVTAAFRVSAGGVVTQIATSLAGSTHADSGASTWADAVDTDGTVIRAKVTGQAGTTINWNVEIDSGGAAP